MNIKSMFFWKKPSVKPIVLNNIPSTNDISSLAMVSNFSDLHNTNVDNYSYIGKNSIIHNTCIGKFCSIGPNVVIGYGEHPVKFVSTSPVFYQSTTGFNLKPQSDLFFGHQRVFIGSDVWIGANCVIRNGVTIGHGSIIGAGAVVTRDVEAYNIVAGVPAIFKKSRFDKIAVNKLLAIEWWNWDLEKIKIFHKDFGTDNIYEFIDKHSL